MGICLETNTSCEASEESVMAKGLSYDTGILYHNLQWTHWTCCTNDDMKSNLQQLECNRYHNNNNNINNYNNNNETTKMQEFLE